MKNFYLLSILFLCTLGMFAQTPQKMNYQTVVRNSSDIVLANQNVGIQISILQGSAMGTAVYVETQIPTTNANGLANIEIGTGSVVSGVFSTIDWANNTYFIKTEIDITGGTSYTITGTSQLASVPYALYAANSGSAPQVVVVDNLISTNTTEALSANQGKVLEDTKLNKTLASASVFVGDASNNAVATTISGDATLANNGTLTIANNAVAGTDISLASEAAGDIMYNNGTDWVRLPKGTAGQALTINAGATAPEWVTTSASANVNIIQVSLTATISPSNAAPVSFTETLFSKGSDLSLQVDGTVAGLKAGRTYKITAHLSGRGTVTSGLAVYNIYDYTSNAIIGESLEFIANSYVYTYSQKPSGISYITPTVDTAIGLRAAASGANYNIGNYTTFTVEEVN